MALQKVLQVSFAQIIMHQVFEEAEDRTMIIMKNFPNLIIVYMRKYTMEENNPYRNC